MIQVWIKATLVAGALVVGLASVYIFKMKPDNPIEETCEKVIKDATDNMLDVDLTPGTPENKTSSDVKPEEEATGGVKK